VSRRRLLVLVLGAFLTSGILIASDPRDHSISGLFAYFAVSIVAALLFWFAWQSIKDLQPPKWLFTALIIGFSMRLGVGIGLTLALPSMGYSDSGPHQAGYIFLDAYTRDTDAWNVARGDGSILATWLDPENSDQYGGLALLSTAVYRIFSPDVRRPLLMILLSATVGSLAILFTWSFTRRLFSSPAAQIAAWLVAIYPEAVLLGSSQMREPFLITALAMGLVGLARARSGNDPRWWRLPLLGLLMALFISPPFALIFLGILVLAWLWEGRGKEQQRKWAWTIIAALGIAAAGLTVRGWTSIEGRPPGGFFSLINWWVAGGAQYQLSLLIENSGWVQKIFGLVPEWSQMFLATMYGLVQPFLPAALLDSTSAPLIRILVSWRALGWFLLLPCLIYAPLLAVRKANRRTLAFFFVFVVWITAIAVSYRDAGRMWDNPRWRVVFLSIQAALAGWTWMKAIEMKSPWLRRTAVIVGFATLAFLQWEAGRYYDFPRLNLWNTLGLIAIFSSIFVAGSLMYDRSKFARRGT